MWRFFLQSRVWRGRLTVGILAMGWFALAPGAVLGEQMAGVTVTDPWRTSAVVASLAALPRKATARIVFDEFVAASEYGDIPARIHAVANTMGEILDSAYVAQYSVAEYKARTQEYIDRFGKDVDIWEIGNEVNGEWLGDQSAVVQKITGAYDLVKRAGGRTALTLYYNKTCYDRAGNEMFAWTSRNIPAAIKNGVDYVLVSYYEDDCPGPLPNWQSVFAQLGEVFPNAKLGIGECGTTRKKYKADYIRRYYLMAIDHPRYVGGHFWWYFNEDMVPRGTTLWNLLAQVLQAQAVK